MITQDMSDRLCTMAEGQLHTQASRSSTLDAGAIGVMAADAAFATTVIRTGAADLWIAALTLLGVSLGLAVRSIRLPGAGETGPSLRDTIEVSATAAEDEVRRTILERFAIDVRCNEQALARKMSLFDRALVFAVLGIVLGLAVRL